MTVIRSPIIWMGSKGRYSEIIKQNLPDKGEVTKALDLFAGSGEVGVGMMDYNHVTCNDFMHQLVGMHNMFKNVSDAETFIDKLISLEKDFGLGKPPNKKDELYKKKIGVLKDNYINFRENVYNLTKLPEYLYILHCNSFSNGVRFSQNGSMTQPYGERYFNPSLQKKMKVWIDLLQGRDVEFVCNSFKNLDFNDYDFVYADPPYLFSDSSYQESKKTAWSARDDYALYNKLANYKGKWMLSNQLYSKGKHNYILQEFIDQQSSVDNNNIRVVELSSQSYKNCNYQREDKKTVELLIMNY